MSNVLLCYANRADNATLAAASGAFTIYPLNNLKTSPLAQVARTGSAAHGEPEGPGSFGAEATAGFVERVSTDEEHALLGSRVDCPTLYVEGHGAAHARATAVADDHGDLASDVRLAQPVVRHVVG